MSPDADGHETDPANADLMRHAQERQAKISPECNVANHLSCSLLSCSCTCHSQADWAYVRQMEQRRRSQLVDRAGWTIQQWVDDARALMEDIDGAITSLVNGHVLALLDEIDTKEDTLKRVQHLAGLWENDPRLEELAAARSADGDDSLTRALAIGHAYAVALRAALKEPT